MGMGTLGGFKLNVEDRGDLGPDALYAAVQDALKKASQNPALAAPSAPTRSTSHSSM